MLPKKLIFKIFKNLKAAILNSFDFLSLDDQGN